MHILIIAHSETPPTDTLLPLLHKAGHTTTEVRPLFGEALPNPSTVDGLIILGAAANLSDTPTLTWLKKEIAWITEFLTLTNAHGKPRPIFGICFGCQILAKILGGRVYKGKQGREFGYMSITKVTDDAVFRPDILAKEKVFQAHGDTYEPPKEAVQLLKGDFYPQQATKFSENVYGVQFHPEINTSVVGRWHRYGQENPALFGHTPPPPFEEHMAQVAHQQKTVHAWLEGFLERLFA